MEGEAGLRTLHSPGAAGWCYTAGMQKLGVGIIGFGRIGAEHAGWIRSSGEAEVVAVCDPTESRLEHARRELAEGGREVCFATTIEEMLAMPQVQAVLVATPSAMHYEQAVLALRGGRHVIVEKPMTLHFEDAERLVECAEQHKVLLNVFHNRRWDADYLRVKRIVEAGSLGRLINVESRLHQYASCVGPAAKEYRPNWRNEAAFGGGGLYDWGSHFVDQLWRLMLPRLPLRLYAQLRGNVWSTDCDDLARLVIDFDDGAVALLEINCTTARPLPRWHLDGTTGSVDSPSDLGFDTQRWANLSFTPAPGRAPLTLPAGDEVRWSEAEIWRRFSRAVLSGEPSPIPARSVLPTIMLLDAARESSHSGCTVLLGSRFGELLTGG